MPVDGHVRGSRAAAELDAALLAETQALCDEMGRQEEARFPGLRRESPQPVPADSPAGRERLQRAARWLDDLTWHKRMYRPARFRWWPEHLIDICTRTTGGQLDFTTVADLELLRRHRSVVQDVVDTFGGAIGQRLADAYMTVGSYDTIGAELGLTMTDIRVMVIWSAPENSDSGGWIHPQISRVLRVVGRQPFRNPLIETWELLQLQRMYRAAVDIFEDLTVDLIGELRGRRPDAVLAAASGSGTVERMERRVRWAHEARGGPGDPRRYPNQFFTAAGSSTTRP
ncbi:hypothetical protein SAMN05660350_04827 [Geodermatophilus obscurus]|uniref:Uncharacterized protein n=1 Tax=Geodermatophilus obscurus TaxID=1861 RepID=A0A1M7V0W7_9ACTN|nr:hypothetical protein [Geodermatophilus obscurus]SHN88837.1 hypothetical protein SAMN05660350_04827 [Geodermatophilus obscurus]